MGLKLLCVTAHPDDECVAFGGVLALMAERGVATSVVCMTDGQAAKNRGDAASAETLGAMRREEFHNSCKVLGVTHHEILDYQDAELEFVEFAAAAGRLVECIRRLKPDVVLTFGSEGWHSSHKDHTVVSTLTTAAFHWSWQETRYPHAGAPHQARRLFYATATFRLPNRPLALMAPWTVTLDTSSTRERKAEALRQHVSQAPLIERNRAFLARFADEEHFALAATTELGPARLGTDLFEGLD